MAARLGPTTICEKLFSTANPKRRTTRERIPKITSKASGLNPESRDLTLPMTSLKTGLGSEVIQVTHVQQFPWQKNMVWGQRSK
jgi:hypothetical protein